MPRSWPRQPDRKDPDYRKVEDIMNFVVHASLFATSNSGLWFFKILRRADWSWATNFTLVWLGILVLHALYVFKLADYSVKPHG